MTTILHNLPDVSTFSANIVVFLAAISAAVVGSMSAVKAIKKSVVELVTPEDIVVTKTQVLGGILQDQYGSAMLAEQLRNNNNVNEDLKEAVCENTREVRELRHQMDRMIDALRSNTSGR